MKLKVQYKSVESGELFDEEYNTVCVKLPILSKFGVRLNLDFEVH